MLQAATVQCCTIDEASVTLQCPLSGDWLDIDVTKEPTWCASFDGELGSCWGLGKDKGQRQLVAKNLGAFLYHL